MLNDGACLQDPAQKSSQAPPTKKPTVYPADGAESTLSRPPTLHKQPPALPPKPFARLPNHIAGAFAFVHCCIPDSMRACLILSSTPTPTLSAQMVHR